MPALRPIEHGTYKGAQLHRKRGEQACRACLDAAAEYEREYRATLRRVGRDPLAAQRRAKRISGKALRRLARLHPIDYRRLLDEEEAKES